MLNFDAVAKKILRPPSAQNCARLNSIGDESETTRLIVNFALGIPPFNYISAIKQCSTHVQFGLSLETAKNAVLRSGSPAGRQQNAAFVEAFFNYDETRGYSRLRNVENFDGEYRLSRDVRVPTRPTFTILENGELVPVSLCGWKSLPLDIAQMRFWMTMLEEGLYSHADYRRSAAEIVFLLGNTGGIDSPRIAHVIKRGDYTLLSRSEMRDQADLYVKAQAAALPIAKAIWEERERKRNDHAIDTMIKPEIHEPTSPGLFD
ncbi:hypothetical protein IFT54_16090 [Sphingomonas sp. CFBP 13714]|uniref:hypothetical protein n=1 Tax=Sphingomonas sp. CFBP 13714 TaxID=2775308 RepID=UPI001783FD26|nr:hypothetical protein [Sphingomonas sp. CFBP 13714]MBD8701336.1 hypothetical protein [Sphingomonas sp. CFBP 13714]